MKKNFFYMLVILLTIFTLSVNFVSATTTTEPCSLDISIINQDPYPAIPGAYLKVTFQVTGVQNDLCKGAKFMLTPTYPFSLDGNQTWETLDDSTYVLGYSSNWIIPYKIRVDPDALEGNADLEIKYTPGSNTDPNFYLSKIFSINIQDSRTQFDAVIQEVSGSDVSIALANVGEYTANSVIVRIPQQDNFIVSGTDGQMVGNLDSGDYSLVGFSISKKINKNMTRTQQGSSETSNLKFDIYYTDNVGERRIVNMELPLQMANGNSTIAGFSRKTTSSSWFSFTNIIIFIFVLIVAWVVYKKYPKIKTLFKKKENSKEKGKK